MGKYSFESVQRQYARKGKRYPASVPASGDYRERKNQPSKARLERQANGCPTSTHRDRELTLPNAHLKPMSRRDRLKKAREQRRFFEGKVSKVHLT